jgi:hypothetical protein
VAATCSAWPQLAGFLQRRRPSLHPLSPPKPLVLGVLASLLQEREPMAVLSTVYDALNAASAAQQRTVAQQSQQATGSAQDNGAVEPEAVTREVGPFNPPSPLPPLQWVSFVTANGLHGSAASGSALAARGGGR